MIFLINSHQAAHGFSSKVLLVFYFIYLILVKLPRNAPCVQIGKSFLLEKLDFNPNIVIQFTPTMGYQKMVQKMRDQAQYIYQILVLIYFEPFVDLPLQFSVFFGFYMLWVENSVPAFFCSSHRLEFGYDITLCNRLTMAGC